MLLLPFCIGKKVTSLPPPETLIILSTYSRALSSRPRCHKNRPAKYRACCPAVLRCSFIFASNSRIASRSEKVLIRAFVDNISKYYKRAAHNPGVPKQTLFSVLYVDKHTGNASQLKILTSYRCKRQKMAPINTVICARTLLFIKP